MQDLVSAFVASLPCFVVPGPPNCPSLDKAPETTRFFKALQPSLQHCFQPQSSSTKPPKATLLVLVRTFRCDCEQGPVPPLPGIAVHLLEAPATCTGPTTNHAAGLATPRGIGSSTIILSRRNSKRIGPRIFVNKSDSLSSELTFTSLHSLRSLNACTQS